MLDARFAEAAHVKLGDRLSLRGGGETPARQAEDVTLAISGGPRVVTDPDVADLTPVAQAMGVRLSGILGDDVLRRYVVALDYRSGAVRFSGPDGQPPPDAAPMGFIATPFVSASASQGGREASAVFQIDTGSNTAVEFWAPFADSDLPRVATTAGARLGIAGDSRTARGRIDALTVAGQRIVGLVANFADHSRPDDAGRDYGGVIGGPAWAGRVLILDFPQRRIWLR